MSVTEIKVGGFGGQGVILTGIIIGKAAAIFDDKYSTMTQAFGPEARGSSCSSQVIISEDPILYPYVTAPKVLVVMSQDAYTRFAPQMSQDDAALLLYEKDLVKLDTVKGLKAKAYGIPAHPLRRGAGAQDGAQHRHGGLLHGHQQEHLGGRRARLGGEVGAPRHRAAQPGGLRQGLQLRAGAARGVAVGSARPRPRPHSANLPVLGYTIRDSLPLAVSALRLGTRRNQRPSPAGVEEFVWPTDRGLYTTENRGLTWLRWGEG